MVQTEGNSFALVVHSMGTTEGQAEANKWIIPCNFILFPPLTENGLGDFSICEAKSSQSIAGEKLKKKSQIYNIIDSNKYHSYIGNGAKFIMSTHAMSAPPKIALDRRTITISKNARKAKSTILTSK